MTLFEQTDSSLEGGEAGVLLDSSHSSEMSERVNCYRNDSSHFKGGFNILGK